MPKTLTYILEKVQHRATKLLPQLANLPYQQRTYPRLKMYSLYCKRQRGDLIETFKILKWYLDVDHSNFTLSPIDFTRGHDYKLFKPRSKLLVRSKFFTNRVIDLWNGLPYQVINAQSVMNSRILYISFGQKKDMDTTRGQWPVYISAIQ